MIKDDHGYFIVDSGQFYYFGILKLMYFIALKFHSGRSLVGYYALFFWIYRYWFRMVSNVAIESTQCAV